MAVNEHYPTMLGKVRGKESFGVIYIVWKS